jgi:integrative and conjugative element protein (TIGR02256 family)
MTREARIKIVRVSTVAAEKIFRQATAHLPSETGGILVGYVLDANAIITHIIGAGPSGQHSLGSFMRDGTYSQVELQKLYDNSGGELNYWGEWHSHPRAFPSPSGIDQSSMGEIAISQAYGFATPILIICERQQYRRWRLLAFQWCGDSLSPRGLIIE